MSAVFEVNGAVIKKNMLLIKSYLSANTKCCAVVKANAYGHGIERVAKAIQHLADFFAVSCASEALTIRKANIKTPILILTPLSKDELQKIIHHNVAFTVTSLVDIVLIEEVLKMNKDVERVSIHIKIDCGMNRLGVADFQEFLEIIKRIKVNKRLLFEGLFTHFHLQEKSEIIQSYNIFKPFVQFAKSNFDNVIVHCCSSNAFLICPEYHCDMVRVGILLYGYLPNENVQGIINVRRCANLYAEVLQTRCVKKNEVVSYSATHKFENDCTIAVVRLGYADGLNRLLSNVGAVWFKGERLKIVGMVCMDMFMVECGKHKIVKNDKVAIICEKQTAEDIAKLINTISYEVLTNLSNRIERKYVLC